MKYRLMDLLACPICKSFPLRLLVFEEREVGSRSSTAKCEVFCGFHGKSLSDLRDTDCGKCASREVSEAILLCEKCGRWYPVDEDIPRMLPDELRNRNRDVSFLSRWKEKVPRDVLTSGKPFNLST